MPSHAMCVSIAPLLSLKRMNMPVHIRLFDMTGSPANFFRANRFNALDLVATLSYTVHTLQDIASTSSQVRNLRLTFGFGIEILHCHCVCVCVFCLNWFVCQTNDQCTCYCLCQFQSSVTSRVVCCLSLLPSFILWDGKQSSLVQHSV